MKHDAVRPGVLVWLGVVASCHVAVAQVGYDPAHSPFRDVRHGGVVRLIVGQYSGERGKVPVGPSDGPTGGLRFEYAASNLFTFTTGLAYAQTTAYFFDAYDSLATKQGPVDNDLVLLDAGLQASLTGGKSFHGFQPYVGGTLGIVFGSSLAADTSGYTFGTKFSYGPDFGVRWFPAGRLSFEFSYRIIFYKLQYPYSYRLHLLPLSEPLSETTSHPWATVGVGWTF